MISYGHVELMSFASSNMTLVVIPKDVSKGISESIPKWRPEIAGFDTVFLS